MYCGRANRRAISRWRGTRAAELAGRIAEPRARESLPDVAEQQDVLELVLEETKEPKKFGVVVPEGVGPAAGAEVNVRYHCDMHVSS